jgi:carbamoyl-phosphate synthase large subunit
MENILVSGVGGPTPRSFVRAVKGAENNKALPYRFIGMDCNSLAYGLYDDSLFDAGYLVPRADEEDYWPAVNNIVEKENITAAVIMPEQEVLEWALSRTRLEKDIKTHLPEYALARILVNKYSLHKYLQDIPVTPRFSIVNCSSYDYKTLSKELGEGFWIRSTKGSSGLGSLKITSESVLHQWISINQEVEKFIATEYLPGRNMACKMLYFDGRLKRTACAERINYIMAKVAPSGITGNTSFGRLINEPDLIRISEKALESIASRIEATLNGIFTVDFKEDSRGNPKITEINIRHVAFTSSIAAGGANLPLDTLKAMFSSNSSAMKRIDYTYDEPLIFLRDVDVEPVLMKESQLLQKGKNHFDGTPKKTVTSVKVQK